MMSEDVLKTLADMGCYRVWIGSESGSQRILDAMRRGVKTEQVHWATKQAQKAGIQVGMFLMWGYDGETFEDIEATVEHVKRCNPDIFFTTVSYPIKNTAYFERVSGLVTLGKRWEEGTDRDYAIAGRPSKAYYQIADRWLKKEMAAVRAEDAESAGALLEEAASAKAELLRQSPVLTT
jgi:radical SAM superfamily enzyme YgiQ (UPF0313 family)